MKTPKKIVKTVFINLLIFIICFVSLDYFLCEREYFKEKKVAVKNKIKIDPFEYSLKMVYFGDYYKSFARDKKRKEFGLQLKKPPILVFGCSYAYGYSLLDKQTFCYKLSLLSKRPVFNRSYSGWGLQQMLYQVRRNDFYKEVKEPEYVIYVFMPDHVRRLYFHSLGLSRGGFYIGYKEKRGRLEETKPLTLQLSRFYMFKIFQQNFIIDKILMNEKNQNKNFDLLKKHFVESKNAIQKKYPKTKFIILKYPFSLNMWYSTNNRWKELEKEGFIVLDLEQLTGRDLTQKKYKLADGHPNEKAWDLIVPKLVEKLNL